MNHLLIQNAPIFVAIKSATPFPNGYRPLKLNGMNLRNFLLSFALLFVAATGFAQFGGETLLDNVTSFQGLAFGDLNNDGKEDIVTTEINWYPQIENGEFGAGRPIGQYGELVYLKDIDADGWKDIVVGEVGGAVVWYRNLGNGQFGAAIVINSFFDASYIDFGDYDGDGDLDLVLGSFGGARWYHNTDGLGTFVQDPSPYINSNSLVSNDFDGDGDLDLLVGQLNQISWLENTDGAGTFGNETVLVTSSGFIYSMEDINADGMLDLIASNSNSIVYYPRSSTTSFSPNFTLIAGNANPIYHFFKDLNNDGLLDAVYSSYNSHVFGVPQKPDHSFGPSIQLSDENVDRIWPADLDGNGATDIIILQPNKVGWLANLDFDAFKDHVLPFNPHDPQFFSTINYEMGDIDGDGLMDAAIFEGKQKGWQRQLPGKKLFSEFKSIPNQPDFDPYYANDLFKLLDWDGDADLDLVTVGNTKMVWYENAGGNFSDGKVLADSVGVAPLQVSDIDHDGDYDLLARYTDGVGLYFWKNTGSGGLQRQLIYPITVPIERLAVADAGKDGDEDVFLSYFDQNTFQAILVYIENMGGGNFSAPATVTNSTAIYLLEMTADFSDDGAVSVLTLNTQASTGAIVHEFRFNNATQQMENIGQAFSVPQVSPYSLRLLSAKDMDGDGDKDLLYNVAGQQVFLWREYENGAFISEQTLASNLPSTSRLLLEDMDGDGDDDICSFEGGDTHLLYPSITNGMSLSWYENKAGSFAFADRRIIAPRNENQLARYADMDGDGDLDIVAHRRDHITMYENYDGLGHFASGQKIGFQQSLGFPDQYYNQGIHIYDYDNDSDLDVLFEQISLSLHKNNGNGTYSPVSAPNAGFDDLITVDINGDGYLDLVGYDNITYKFKKSVYQPATSNYSAESQVFDAGEYISGVNHVDLDHDGDQDLLFAVGNNDAGPLKYALNDGSGNFGSAQVLLADCYFKIPVKIADIDLDGYEDILVSKNSAYPITQLLWFKTTGDASLVGPPNLVNEVQYFGNIFLQDMDADGDKDVVSVNKWFENLGNGAFGPSHDFEPFQNYDLALNELVGVADINGDGTPDILQERQFVIVPPSIASGHEDFFKPILNRGSAGIPKVALIPLDADLDGDLDLLQGAGSTINWWENKPVGGHAHFEESKPLLKLPYGVLGFMGLADVDNDGIEDLTFLSAQAGGWYKRSSNGTFSGPALCFQANNSGQPIGFETADFDNDNDIDFLVNGSYLYENLGNGVLFELQILNPGAVDTKSMDVDGDGDVDIISVGQTTAGEIWVSKNLGNLQFGSPELLVAANNVYLNAKTIKPVDLDKDNLEDIVVVGSVGGGQNYFDQILYFKNMGGGNSFQPVVIADVPGYGNFMHVSNTAGNASYPDIAYSVFSDSMLHWLIQKSPGTFQDTVLEMTLPVDFSGLATLAFGDFDNDLDEDIAYSKGVENWEGKHIGWRENLGTNPTISSQMFFDLNQNAVFDSTEVPLLGFKSSLNPGELLSFPDNTGSTTYFVDLGTWELSHVPKPEWNLTTGTPSYPIQIDTLPFHIKELFGFYPALDTIVLEPHLVSGPTRCNFSVPFWLNMANTGTLPATGQLKLVLPPLVSVDSADMLPDLVSGDTLVWDFQSLYPTYTQGVKLYLKMPNENLTGEWMHFHTLACVPDVALDTVYVFQHEYSSPVTCAIDPNDKIVNPNRKDEYPSNYTLFGERLEYTIRFQNTGNDTALNITLLDHLDANLDRSTFQPLAASHAYEATLDNTGLLKVLFRNIMLPDSNVNKVTSNGFFSYSIFPKPGLPESTDIANTANIYFDYNQAIVTNTTNNVLVTMLPTSVSEEHSSIQGFKIYPNPVATGRSLTVETPWEDAEVCLTDVYGRTIADQKKLGKSGVITLPEGYAGLHLLTISNGKERVVFKVVIMD